ncbi:MAG: hypothetical protein IPL73_29585 [Candidatus Obscuribacter sp.]|nr:hypothetical protein [Candidatus Obscuribacter sp.]
MKNRTTILTRLTLFLCIALMGSTNACMAQFYNGNQSNNSRDLTVFYATSRYNESPSGRPLYGGARHLDIGAGSLDYGAINLLRPDQGWPVSRPPTGTTCALLWAVAIHIGSKPVSVR